MANIQFLHWRWRPQRDAIAWDWKPSPRLRKAGWRARHLGDGPPPAGRGLPIAPDEVVRKANDLNRQLEAWDLGVAQVAAARPAPRHYTFSDLLDAYRAGDEYRTQIKAHTRRNYDSCFARLEYWARDGQLPIRAIDTDMVVELKDALLANGGSRFKCASMLAVLRMLMRWAAAPGRRYIPHDPTHGVPIPSPPSRRALVSWRDVRDICAGPAAQASPLGARALRLAFWSMLRREDLSQLSRFQWRELHGADPRDLPALVNAKGQVWGFRVQPEKTRTSSGAWVDCPMPPALHEEIEGAFEQGQWLFPHPSGKDAPVGADLLRRRVKPLLIEFDLAAMETEALEEQIGGLLWEAGRHPGDASQLRPALLEFLCEDLRYHKQGQALLKIRAAVMQALPAAGYVGHQLRDMRRSGMSWVTDMGAERGDVFAISGHPLDGNRRTMADVYMPPQTRKACRAIAAACRTWAAIEAREKKEQGQ